MKSPSTSPGIMDSEGILNDSKTKERIKSTTISMGSAERARPPTIRTLGPAPRGAQRSRSNRLRAPAATLASRSAVGMSIPTLALLGYRIARQGAPNARVVVPAQVSVAVLNATVTETRSNPLLNPRLRIPSSLRQSIDVVKHTAPRQANRICDE